jgi:hypothetical protein
VPRDYDFSLSVTEYAVYSPPAPGFIDPEPLSVTVTNTGNQPLFYMQASLESGTPDNFLLEDLEGGQGTKIALPDRLGTGESTAFTIYFLVGETDTGLQKTASVTIGNARVEHPLSLQCGVFNSLSALSTSELTISPNSYLQSGSEGHTSAAAGTSDPAYSAGETPWFSSNPSAAVIDPQTGVLTVVDGGDTIIGFIASWEPFTAKGRSIHIYPAVQTLNPLYPVNTSTTQPILTRPQGFSALPTNTAQIEEARSGAIVFSLKDGDGKGIISAINAATGEITFNAEAQNGAYADITVNLELQTAVPSAQGGGTLVTHRGSASFLAAIGPAATPIFLYGNTVNLEDDKQAWTVEAYFSDVLTASDAKAGFRLTRKPAAAEEETEAPDPENTDPWEGHIDYAIDSASINANRITFTLSNTSPVTFVDDVYIGYDGTAGTVHSSNTPLESFGPELVTNNLPELESGPVLLGAAIDGSSRESAARLTLTYNTLPLAPANPLGFSMLNAQGAQIAFSGAAAQTLGEEPGPYTYTMTLTMSREPTWAEAQADNLVLYYNGQTGSLTDEAGNPAVGGTVPVTLSGFTEDEYLPPALIAGQPVKISNATPGTVTVTFDRDITGGFGGFSLNVSDLSITGSAVAGAVLSLQLNRALTKAEAQSAAQAGGLTLSYNAVNGNIKDAKGNAAASFAATAVTVEGADAFINPAVVSTLTIQHDAPRNLVLSFDKAVTLTSAEGFFIEGSVSATAFTGVSGNGTAAITLTLNRKPAYSERNALYLHYNASQGNVRNADNGAVALATFSGTSGASASQRKKITLSGFTNNNSSRPTVQGAPEINADPNFTGTVVPESAKRITISFNKTVSANNHFGFTVSGSKTATEIVDLVVPGDSTLVLILNAPPSYNETLLLSYDIGIGNVETAENDNALDSFANKQVTLTRFVNNYIAQDAVAPRIKGASVAHETPAKLRIVFSEPVTVDAASFLLRAATIPGKDFSAGNIGDTGFMMDDASSAVRTFTNAHSVSDDDTEWELTMSAPAAYGEVLRLSSTEEGAALDTWEPPNRLPLLTQFIVKNNVKRYTTKPVFEAQAGFYNNGSAVQVSGGTNGDQLFANAVKHLNTANTPESGHTYTLVLAQNQTFSKSDFGGVVPFSDTAFTNGSFLQGSFYTLILTTPTGNSSDITITGSGSDAGLEARNGLTIIIDEHIVFQYESGSSLNTMPLIKVSDGGRVILDGGTIRNNRQRSAYDIAGGVQVGGSGCGGFFIMNSGKIYGNTAQGTGTSDYETVTTQWLISNLIPSYQKAVFNRGGAGGVYLKEVAMFVMHGGELYNNAASLAGTFAAAGGVFGNFELYGLEVTYLTGVTTSTDNRQHGRGSFYMTGGEIYGNSVGGTPRAAASAGGVLVSGSFQKTGGTIYGSDAPDPAKNNTTNWSGNIRISAAAVTGQNSNNPNYPYSQTWARERTAGPELSLFIDSVKTSLTTRGVNTKPTWAQSFWD